MCLKTTIKVENAFGIIIVKRHDENPPYAHK
jgi:hypothetical protein